MCLIERMTKRIAGILKVRSLPKKRPRLAFVASCETCSASVKMAVRLCLKQLLKQPSRVVMKLNRSAVMHATLFDRNTDMGAKLVKDRATGSTMRGQLETTKRQASALKIQLASVRLAPGKSSREMSKTEAHLCARVVLVVESLNVEKAPVERL